MKSIFPRHFINVEFSKYTLH